MNKRKTYIRRFCRSEWLVLLTLQIVLLNAAAYAKSLPFDPGGVTVSNANEQENSEMSESKTPEYGRTEFHEGGIAS